MGAVSEPLIQWFELNRRLLPFRQEPSAYHIWVSEIMLQQTRVSAALPYYERFVAELPDPAALAACDPDKLRKLWQGLGYYSRVANMQRQRRSSAGSTAASFPQIMPPCALCPALGITRLGLLPPLHLASQPRRWTATCCGYLPGWIIALPILPNLPPSARSQPVCWKKCPRNAPALITRR